MFTGRQLCAGCWQAGAADHWQGDRDQRLQTRWALDAPGRALSTCAGPANQGASPIRPALDWLALGR